MTDGWSKAQPLLDALGDYGRARRAFLASVGLASSNRDPLAEVSEHLVCSLLQGVMAESRVQKGWDLTIFDGQKVQVRYLANPADPPWVNEHLVDFRTGGADLYALVIYEGFEPRAVLVFSRRTLAAVGDRLGKRHGMRDTTLQITRRNYLQLLDERQTFAALDVMVHVPPRSHVDKPADSSLPFFAYGIFRPGQLAFFQLADLVAECVDPVAVPGRLLVRDGLPLVDLGSFNHSTIEGALLRFRPGAEDSAYERIANMEPDDQYRWRPINLQEGQANILVARQPGRGSDDWGFESHEAWDGWRDPVFTDALAVVDETLGSSRDFDPGDMRPTFRLQMAYLLLWSSIERYLSLRYHLGSKDGGSRLTTYGLVKKLAKEPAFAEALQGHVQRPRRIYRADDPGRYEDLVPDNPGKSLGYYYQVRSNITHRGKAVMRDHKILVDALSELPAVFRYVLDHAKAEAEQLAASL